MQAQVFKIHSDYYWVQSDFNDDCTIYECRLRANLKKQRAEVLVGDYVDIEEINDDSHQAVIYKIQNRKNYMPRPKVANIDRLVIVSAIKEPDLDFEQLNRYIALAQYNNIKPVLCFNKEDLADSTDVVEKVFDIYEPLGFEIYFTSALEKNGIDDIKKILDGKLCAFAGSSGVGKTSLINAISSNFKLKTGSVSEKTKRGTHTTRHCEIVKIKMGKKLARILDTPGFSHLSFDFIMPKDVENLFPDIKQFSGQCKFSDCLHINETGCNVINNLDKINTSRYESYCKFVEEAKIYKEKIKNAGYKQETTSKLSGNKNLTKVSIKKRQQSRVNEKKVTNEYEKYN